MQGALRLASCSADGVIRIYEALEPTNLTQWSQMEEFTIDMGKGSSSSAMTTPALTSVAPTSSLLSQQQQLQQHQLHEQLQLQQIQQGNLEPFQQQQKKQLQQQQLQLPQQLQQLQLQHQQSSSSSPSSQQGDHQSIGNSKDQEQQSYLSQSQLQRQQQQQQYEQQQQEQQQQEQQNMSGSRLHPPHLGNLSSPPSNLQQHLPLQTPNSSSSGGSNSMDTPQLPFGTHLPATPGIPPPMTLPGVAPSLTMSSLDQHQPLESEHHQHRPIDIESGYCIHWCPNRTSHPMMVVGLGKEYGAKIFKHDGHNRWYPGELLFGHTNQVNDVSWAPSMGRSYQLIATACKDHYVRIFKLTDTMALKDGTRVNVLSKQSSTTKSSGNFHVEMVAEFGQHQAEVWRVEWNIMGTILSSSGSDGTVRLWKAGYDGQWREMAVINTSNQQKSV
ncbi:uncharacterized protein BX664DRAFT_203630 [Halteromyces radiatus]|uniref:uncharacterized protein n=1 Tax=Halteromyces radiatus TaxID=101107 RepID=UPI00221FCD47|nr:uncharacterized protein BX664DRAFT_203630 [Halteromyces radiatus]KAI8079852.1 hypothetical protein BX664DRAFT_203630 [Halteromyces radiatus]